MEHILGKLGAMVNLIVMNDFQIDLEGGRELLEQGSYHSCMARGGNWGTGVVISFPWTADI